MLDLHAPIVPGRSAAGFSIGQTIHELTDAFKGAQSVTYREGFDLVQAINQNTGILRIDGFGPDSGAALHFGPDTVRLVFSKTGGLYCIYLFDGYLGGYGTASIGSPLSTISDAEALLYDEGDEMYYRVDPDGEYIPGFAICAGKAGPEQYAETIIYGFCVHDWTRAQNAT